MNTLLLELFSLIFIGGGLVFGCSRLSKSSLLVLDGVNVAETPSLLMEIEALKVPVTIAVSIQDLRDFPTVRLVAKEAVMRGHHVILSSADSPIPSAEIKKEWAEYLGGVNLKYTSKSIEYTLDLSPDHLTAIPQLVKEKITETPSLGRVIYLNSFVPNAKEKAVSAIRTYQNAGFQFISLPDCLKKQ